ncbi:MAG: ABC transporter ATP-binding protein [Dehalococcoidia bacterium]|nr:ABC transporter ATP-binding protein [Euryarchaeota archaeon]MCH2521347.1 ABC transporter ATP-binding protein [Dehalococcoidia bacterium]
MTESGPSVEVINVRKVYPSGDGERAVLDGASATIGSGERVAILGPSGSGKSTLLNLLSGIDEPDQGTIEINGSDLRTLSETERTLFRRNHIGFVFQSFNLLPALTVLENLLLPLELIGRTGNEANERARSLLEMVELSKRADSFPDRLSGGEQQRVAIARAVVHEPSLLLADEPTGNLDEDTSHRLIERLEDLISIGKTTLVVVTHSRQLADRMDRALRLDRGGLVEY